MPKADAPKIDRVFFADHATLIARRLSSVASIIDGYAALIGPRCSGCGGRGEINGEVCPECHGEGVPPLPSSQAEPVEGGGC